MALTREIDVHNAIGVRYFAVASETVEDERQTLVALHIARAFEKFIQHGTDQILCGWNKARRRNLIRKLAADEAIVVCEINIHFHI